MANTIAVTGTLTFGQVATVTVTGPDPALVAFVRVQIKQSDALVAEIYQSRQFTKVSLATWTSGAAKGVASFGYIGESNKWVSVVEVAFDVAA
jgi:hypothetical protein